MPPTPPTPHDLERSAGLRGGLTPWQACRLDRYIERHLAEPLRVAELAGEVGLSASHFSRAFRQSFETTPHAYVVAARLRRAGALLLASEEALGQIAVGCGFTDQAHLTRLFRSHFGETPGAWRRCRRAPHSQPRRELTALHSR